MKQIDLPLATTTWDDKEYAALDRVIQTGNFTMGAEVRKFESEFAAFVGSKYAVMVNSGSSANLLAIQALVLSPRYDLNPGDEVLVPAVSWSTTYYPVSQSGLTLTFVDVEKGTLNISVEHVESKITERTKAIFAVNLLGNPAALAQLKLICVEHNLLLLEDNCESLGAELSGKQAGTFGVLGTFSTFFSHHISTMEGGVIVTDDSHLYEYLVSLRAHGWIRELEIENTVHKKTGDSFLDSFTFALPGYNVRPLELEGALGQEQLKKLPSLLAGRRANASFFVEGMKEFSDTFQIQHETGSSSWFGFSLICISATISRSDLIMNLKDWGVECRPVVAGNFTRNPVIRHLSHSGIDVYPNADLVSDHGLFIGNHHYSIEEKLYDLFENFRKLIASN
jgi:CDP-4-dehydro-6-deoxyglucose reductase, E1